MKKFIFAMLLICSGLCANAQTTWSLRAGAGMGLNKYGDPSWATAFNVNSNISLKRHSGWIFSPGLTVNLADKSYGVYFPLQFGYKAKVGENSLFIPKLGLATGYMSGTSGLVGPCGELGFEIKHFTIGVDFYFSALKAHGSYISKYDSTHDYGFHVLFGYKF